MTGPGRSILLLPVLMLPACQNFAPPLEPLRQGPAAPLLLAPSPTVSDLDLGDRLMQAAEFESALGAYARALAAEPGSVAAMAGLAAANLRLGRLNQSQMLLTAVLSRAPEHVEAWNTLGLVRYRQGDLFGAREAFRTAFALSGGSSDAIRRNLLVVEDLADESVPGHEEAVPEIQVVREGQGKYLLLDRPAAAPAG